jgi:hypothetical protein
LNLIKEVNSKSERRILFSIWSPFETEDPNEIPEEFKVKVVSKGMDVYNGQSRTISIERMVCRTG